MLISAAVWWAYLDVVALVAEHRMRATAPGVQTRIPRDSITLLQLPMMAGIVLPVLGIKKTLGDVDERPAGVPALALCAGLALSRHGQIALRLRNVGTLGRRRLVAAALVLALWPVATSVEALFALALVVGVLTVLVGFQVVRFREARPPIRTAP